MERLKAQEGVSEQLENSTWRAGQRLWRHEGIARATQIQSHWILRDNQNMHYDAISEPAMMLPGVRGLACDYADSCMCFIPRVGVNKFGVGHQQF